MGGHRKWCTVHFDEGAIDVEARHYDELKKILETPAEERKVVWVELRRLDGDRLLINVDYIVRLEETTWAGFITHYEWIGHVQRERKAATGFVDDSQDW